MKKVLITGANQGIGFETAKQLGLLGYSIYLGCRDLDKGNEALKELQSLGVKNAELIVIDISYKKGVLEAVNSLKAKTNYLDILINNAGIAGTEPHLIDCDIENLAEIFNTNVFGTLQTIQAFLPLLRKSPHPSIINVSSEVGSLNILAELDKNSSRSNFHVYGLSKTTINALTLMLASELQDQGISVNSVTPGFTATQLNNFQGTKTPAEGAAPIVELATKSESGITGKFFKEGGEAPW
ncbi:SDR family NAD(P)-dependent oxidoreductase [Mucilaginibacter limnophilus]|uniref:SDR family NAD(P)-dependent oxidoreductase n=1 Tax=Mucilaginibacter limnophilus TaxID=1932778 RepID=A0A3S2UJD5_9SPHI|nr:SDR family NAD(P)-dependent oxidoreductase [Mucilaginibacter limnophilus]RVT97213.1 SDR family NAD(P)-dependent oxidoreductase [Mucilaginibacter limnophilus]